MTRTTTTSTHSKSKVLLALLVGMLLAVSACSSKSDSGDGTSSTTAAGKSVSDASNEELETWQKDLNAVGCWAGAVDGEMGPETETAIKEFQQAEGLTVDGLLGPATESALSAAAEKGQQVCKSTTSTTATSSTTASSTSTTSSDDCPGGPKCADVSISPSAGAAGTEISVTVAAGGCADVGGNVVMVDNAGNVVATGTPLGDPGAGNVHGSVSVPAGTAPGAYEVGVRAADLDCMRPFEVTG